MCSCPLFFVFLEFQFLLLIQHTYLRVPGENGFPKETKHFHSTDTSLDIRMCESSRDSQHKTYRISKISLFDMTTAASQHASRCMRMLVVVFCVHPLFLGFVLPLALPACKRASQPGNPASRESPSVHGLDSKSHKASSLLCSPVAAAPLVSTDDRASVYNDYLRADFPRYPLLNGQMIENAVGSSQNFSPFDSCEPSACITN